MKVIKEHRNRFIRLRLLGTGIGAIIETASVKRGMSVAMWGGGIAGMDAETSFTYISRFMHAHPRYSDAHGVVWAAERWARDQWYKYHAIWGMYSELVNDTACEIGMDREEVADNDWSEYMIVAEELYHYAEQWAAKLGFR